MNVQVRLFASYREVAGVGRILIELPTGATVRDAIAEITRRHPLAAGVRELVVAKNHEYASLDDLIVDGDELALIPPVSGGAATASDRIRISPTTLSVDSAIGSVRGPDIGGIVIFLGTVRDHSRGKRVRHLAYEAYAEMAEAKMRQIAQRLEAEHDPLRLAIHHRVGDLAIGEIAVIVVAAAAHRDAAFTAARTAIDELKEVVPIWKKEYTEDGAVWIEDHA